MQKIYNELRKYDGKLTEFAEYLVNKGLFSNTKSAVQAMRLAVRPRQDIEELYEEWKHGRLKTKDINKYNEKVANVFKNIKRRNVKQELIDVRDVIESALMELTLGIKKKDEEKLLTCKNMLQAALYGGDV